MTRLLSYAYVCKNGPEIGKWLAQRKKWNISESFSEAYAEFEYLVHCLLNQLSWALPDGALCQSLTLPSLPASVSAEVQADTPGLCQSIAFIEIVNKVTHLDVKTNT